MGVMKWMFGGAWGYEGGMRMSSFQRPAGGGGFSMFWFGVV